MFPVGPNYLKSNHLEIIRIILLIFENAEKYYFVIFMFFVVVVGGFLQLLCHFFSPKVLPPKFHCLSRA
jgi:hypothetical protein